MVHSPSLRRLTCAASSGLLAILGFALATAPAAHAAGTTRYVATVGSDSDNDCTHKASPCETIQHAVDEAAAGDTVSIAGGTYAEAVTIDKSLTVTGAGRTATKVTGADGEPAFLVLGDEIGATKVTLSQLAGTHVQHAPGAVVEAATVTVSDAAFDDNDVSGLLTIGASVTATDSSFSNNVSGESDGFSNYGIGAIGAGDVVIDRSTLAGNGVAGVYVFAAFGGVAGLAAEPSLAVTVDHSTVSGNRFAGIANGPGGDVTVDQSSVSGNHGFGVYAEHSSTTVMNSTIAGTTKTNVDLPGDPVEDLPDAAGVMYIDEVPDGALQRAAAPSGHGLFNPSASLRIAGHKITAKAARAQRSALAAGQLGISLAGTVLSQPSGTADCAGGTVDHIGNTIEVDYAGIDNGYNVSADAHNSCGFTTGKHDLTKTDPKLKALADNGGPTRTQLLPKGSPALDAIPSGSAGCKSGADDQRGVKRPQGAKCDVGAVEVAQPPLVIKPGSLPHGTVGAAYKATLTATGGLGAPYAFSLASGSSLPTGLALSGSGVISGTPTAAGSFKVTVSVDDPVLKTFTMVIAEPAAGPNGGGEPVAATGAPVTSMTAIGAAAVSAGFLLLLGAGMVGRKPGRHRTTV